MRLLPVLLSRAPKGSELPSPTVSWYAGGMVALSQKSVEGLRRILESRVHATLGSAAR